MIQTLEAVIDAGGDVRLLEPVQLDRRHRAFVTILADEPADGHETALLSEAALGEGLEPAGGRRGMGGTFLGSAFAGKISVITGTYHKAPRQIGRDQFSAPPPSARQIRF